jgi:hypothetical protein
MKASLLLGLLMLCYACGSRGYVPQYILTDSPETKEEVHKCQEEPEQDNSLLESPK